MVTKKAKGLGVWVKDIVDPDGFTWKVDMLNATLERKEREPKLGEVWKGLSGKFYVVVDTPVGVRFMKMANGYLWSLDSLTGGTPLDRWTFHSHISEWVLSK